MTSVRNDTAATNLVTAARGSAGIFLVRVIGVGLGFFVGILLARLLGAGGLGVMAYASAWPGIILIASTLGFQQLLPREVARYHSQAEWGLLRGLLEFSRTSVLFASILLATLAALFAWFLNGFETPSPVIATLWIALIGVPFVSLIQVRQGVMRGLGHVVRGQVPETLIAPVVSCTVFTTIYLLYDSQLRPQEVVSIGLAITILAFLIGNRMLARILPKDIHAAKPDMVRRAWLHSAIPMIMISGLEVINSQTDIIMLGMMTTKQETGIYSVASRGATLAIFAWGSVNAAIGPMIAKTFYNGQGVELQNLVSKSAIAIFLITLPICAILYLLEDEFLSLFGPEFVAGAGTLNILLIGNLVVAMAGSVGLILKMTGHERDVLWTGVVAALANITLNALLIPQFGAEGAAVATAISLSIWALTSCAMLYFRLSINPTIFAPRLLKSPKGWD